VAENPAPARTRRPSAAAAAAGCALLLAVTASACAGDHASANDAAGRPKPAAATSQIGTVDPNPSDAPVLQPSLHPGSPAPHGYRALPATRGLTVSWDWSDWLNHAHALATAEAEAAEAGAKATQNDWQDPVETYNSWRWTTDLVGQFEVGVQTMLPNGMPEPTCSAQNFEPSSASVASQITNILLLCVQTGLSGASEADAESWLRKQIQPELKQINGLTDGRETVSATPTFGSATYYLTTHYTPGYGYVMALQVW